MNAPTHVARAGELFQSRYRTPAPLQVRAISRTCSGLHGPDVGYAVSVLDFCTPAPMSSNRSARIAVRKRHAH